jgi:alginate O-acetyltransferase complex protein AlgI
LGLLPPFPRSECDSVPSFEPARSTLDHFCSGSLFFTYFSYTQLGGLFGAACLGIFLWECFVSRFYKPGSWICWAGIAQTVVFLIIFKYRNFLTCLWWPDPSHNPLCWKNSFLPLGISFFTFEFVHYAVDRYRNKTASGSVGEYLAFILFFPTMVAGPIKRYEDFLPSSAAFRANGLSIGSAGLRAFSRAWRKNSSSRTFLRLTQII